MKEIILTEEEFLKLTDGMINQIPDAIQRVVIRNFWRQYQIRPSRITALESENAKLKAQLEEKENQLCPDCHEAVVKTLNFSDSQEFYCPLCGWTTGSKAGENLADCKDENAKLKARVEELEDEAEGMKIAYKLTQSTVEEYEAKYGKLHPEWPNIRIAQSPSPSGEEETPTPQANPKADNPTSRKPKRKRGGQDEAMV